jgi:hypothetical protein
MQVKSLGITNVDFGVNRSATDQICYTGEKEEHNRAVHQIFIDFKKAQDSVSREVLYNICIEFGISKNNLDQLKCV